MGVLSILPTPYHASRPFAPIAADLCTQAYFTTQGLNSDGRESGSDQQIR